MNSVEMKIKSAAMGTLWMQLWHRVSYDAIFQAMPRTERAVDSGLTSAIKAELA